MAQINEKFDGAFSKNSDCQSIDFLRLWQVNLCVQ